MVDTIPKELEKDPIVESMFELRFSSKEPAVAELLPGMVFDRLREKYKQIINLPLKSLPADIRLKDKNLQYQPIVRLISDDCSIGIGDKVISLSVPRPYPGWIQKKEYIATLLSVLEETQLIDVIERFSLKYMNIVPEECGTGLEALNAQLVLGDFNFTGVGINIKAEVVLDDSINIVTVVPAAYANPEKEDQIDGVLIDVDCIHNETGSNWDDVLSGLENLHATEKKIFFGLLTEPTYKAMKPIME